MLIKDIYLDLDLIFWDLVKTIFKIEYLIFYWYSTLILWDGWPSNHSYD